MTSSGMARRMTHAAGALLLAVALLAVARPVQAQCSNETTQNEAIVRRAFDNWAKGGNVFAELLAPDVRWTIAGSGPVAGTYVGLKYFVDRASVPLISRLATPIVPKVHHIWAIGDTVIVRFDGSATTTSGAAYANQFVWIFRMANGVVTEAEAFLDLVAYQQVVDNNAPRAR
jgi:ketosteroid isomerase-like protein